MLEVATIRNFARGADKAASVGDILDAALYYGRVHLYLDLMMLGGAVKTSGFDDIITLLKHPSVTASVTPDSPAVHSQGIPTRHSVVFISMAFSQDPNEKPDMKRRMRNLFNGERTVPKLNSREIERLIGSIKTTSYQRLLGSEWKTHELWKSLVNDPQSLKQCLRVIAETNGWQLNQAAFERCQIYVFDTDDGYIVESDPPISTLVLAANGKVLQWAEVLQELNNFRLDMYFAASESADLMLSPTSALFAAYRSDLALSRGGRNAEKLQQFNEVLFENGKPLGELYDSGAIDLKTALKIIDQAAKFRDIIKNKPNDTDLLQQYISEISRADILDRAPAKHLKFLTYGAIGAGSLALNPLAGLGVGLATTAFDMYLLPKITGLWKPNMFVRSIKDHLIKL